MMRMMKLKLTAARLFSLAVPIMLYLAAGLLASAGSRNYGYPEAAVEKGAVLCLFLWLYLKDRRLIPQEPAEIPLSAWVISAAAGAGLCLAVNLFFHLSGLTARFAEDAALQKEALSENSILRFIVLLLLSPAAEELVFRGVFFTRMRRWSGFFSSCFVSALIFGVFHGNMLQGIYGFLAGILFAALMERYRNIAIPIAAHAAANAVSLLAMVL